jgi:MFS family permease
MFGGLIGYAVGHIKSGLPRWMYIFLILGSCSILAGICALIFLPDLPSTAKFLTPTERAVAVNRVAANRQGIKNHHFKKYQMWQTFRDPKTWILFIMATGAQVPNSALTSFASIIVKSFGFGTLGTQYLQIPGGAVQFLALLTGGFICTRYKNVRFITMIVANSICILGAGLLVGLPDSNKWGRLVALWLCYFQGLGFSMSLTVVSSNIAGKLTAFVIVPHQADISQVTPRNSSQARSSSQATASATSSVRRPSRTQRRRATTRRTLLCWRATW